MTQHDAMETLRNTLVQHSLNEVIKLIELRCDTLVNENLI